MEIKNKDGLERKTINEDKAIKKVSLVGILGNVLLSSFKLFAGFIGHSGAMISDAVHSFSDVFATLIATIGVKLSKKAADKEHPYGHERFECLASLLLGIILMITGIFIGYSGVKNIISGSYKTATIPSLIALIAAVVSIVTKEAMYWYTRHYAKLLSSEAFMADAWHHRSDALSSIGSLIGIGGAMIGFPIMDSIAQVVICLFILKVAFDILKKALENMTDTSVDPTDEKKIEEFILSHEGVKSIDLFHTRMFGNKVYVDLEISIDGEMKLKDAHQIAENIHLDVENKFPFIKHIMIHVNPA